MKYLGYILGFFSIGVILVCTYFLNNPKALNHGIYAKLPYRTEYKPDISLHRYVFYYFGEYKGGDDWELRWYYTDKEKDSIDRLAEIAYKKAIKTYRRPIETRR